jgi:hypothetical protein
MVDLELLTRRHATKATRNHHGLFMALKDHKLKSVRTFAIGTDWLDETKQ